MYLAVFIGVIVVIFGKVIIFTRFVKRQRHGCLFLSRHVLAPDGNAQDEANSRLDVLKQIYIADSAASDRTASSAKTFPRLMVLEVIHRHRTRRSQVVDPCWWCGHSQPATELEGEVMTVARQEVVVAAEPVHAKVHEQLPNTTLREACAAQCQRFSENMIRILSWGIPRDAGGPPIRRHAIRPFSSVDHQGCVESTVPLRHGIPR